jgi:chromosome segregation ATPase
LVNKDKAIDQLNLTIQKQKQELYWYTENSNKIFKMTAILSTVSELEKKLMDLQVNYNLLMNTKEILKRGATKDRPELEKRKQTITELTEQLEKANNKSNTIKEAGDTREKLNLEIETQQNIVKDLRDTIEEKDTAIEALQEKLTLATNGIEGLNKEKENLHVQLQAQNTQVNPLAVSVKELEILLAKQKETLAQTQNEYTSEHRKVIKSNEDLYRLKLRIQELEQQLTTAEMTLEMRTTTNNKLQRTIKDLKMQLESKDRSLAKMQAELDTSEANVTTTLDEQNSYIAELEAHIATLQQKDSIGLAEMGNQLSATTEEIHIQKDFIERNYQAVNAMYATTATYRECINQMSELNQKIFLMDVQALDPAVGYKLSINQEDQEELRLQKSVKVMLHNIRRS